MSCRQRGHAIGGIVAAAHRPMNHLLLAAGHHRKDTAILRVERKTPIAAVTLTEALYRRPATLCQHPFQRRLVVGDHQVAVTRHGSNEMVKLALDSREISEDIRVIEFQIVENRDIRTVVNELRTLVEERGIVLVRFHDERRTGLAKTRRASEIAQYAADEKTGFETRGFQYPGQHARRGGLAVRPRHRQNLASRQYVLRQPLRPGSIGELGVQQGFDFRIPPGERVTDDDQIRSRLEILGTIALHQLDADLLELKAHRGIDIGIRAGHAISQHLCQTRETAHERATYPHYMNVHTTLPCMSRRA